MESLQAEFDKLSAEWNEQKINTGGGLNASFSHGPSTRRVSASPQATSADDSALSHSQRKLRMQAVQAQYQTQPASPRRRLVERVFTAEGERGQRGSQPSSVSSEGAAGHVGHARLPQPVSGALIDGGLEGRGGEVDVALLDPFADGGEGLLDEEELNMSTA